MNNQMLTRLGRGSSVVGLAVCVSSCSPPAASSPSLGTAPSGSLDVVVYSFTNRPSPVHVGNKVVFDYVLKNVGTNTIAAGTFSFDLFVDGRIVAFDHAGSLMLPGGTVPYSMAPGYFNWQPTNAGRYHYNLVITGGGMTNETGGDIDVLP